MVAIQSSPEPEAQAGALSEVERVPGVPVSDGGRKKRSGVRTRMDPSLRPRARVEIIDEFARMERVRALAGTEIAAND